MNVDVPLADSRRMEVLANGLPLWQATQAAVDTTFVSPIGWPRLHSAGGCGARAGQGGGGTPEQTTYPELLAARRCRLVVLAVEVGGRFGTEMVDFLRRLAVSKARAAPPCAAVASGCHRWTGMLAVAAQRALTLSLL